MRPTLASVLVLASCLTVSKAWADTKLTVLFSGDNSGEIGPCG